MIKSNGCEYCQWENKLKALRECGEALDPCNARNGRCVKKKNDCDSGETSVINDQDTKFCSKKKCKCCFKEDVSVPEECGEALDPCNARNGRCVKKKNDCDSGETSVINDQDTKFCSKKKCKCCFKEDVSVPEECGEALDPCNARNGRCVKKTNDCDSGETSVINDQDTKFCSKKKCMCCFKEDVSVSNGKEESGGDDDGRKERR
ncbi:hypothetical protein Pmani_029354 [Petrolisthes manimaculis]|uniref:Uncharacterized protein n=1 Tax=Petrolisthes manimaculis TaxID=1843537 RepID=A0AAE1NZQ7_9EUCA|nr:hypothetical protein Pmani_029354 [Petrolisthes manimaculis]